LEGWLLDDTLSESSETLKHVVFTKAEFVYNKEGGTYSCHFASELFVPQMTEQLADLQLA
jgi:hypothetical protein